MTEIQLTPIEIQALDYIRRDARGFRASDVGNQLWRTGPGRVHNAYARQGGKLLRRLQARSYVTDRQIGPMRLWTWTGKEYPSAIKKPKKKRSA